jgi:hypothetical protein
MLPITVEMQLQNMRIKVGLITIAKAYDKLSNDEKMLWEMKAREHDIKQPQIKYRIIEHIKKNQ